ncbi:hypothetical protein P278_06950 [Zhouia amylolytica AD3]|uniref:Uncharacterized protein n=1 Tax=Zhouia amylolytica AD3 TaxID=1286632 RepID=W2USY0_9FLAO|nr:hypothetical protein P278_06950 [Zhouia amylolytica AD3]
MNCYYSVMQNFNHIATITTGKGIGRIAIAIIGTSTTIITP